MSSQPRMPQQDFRILTLELDSRGPIPLRAVNANVSALLHQPCRLHRLTTTIDEALGHQLNREGLIRSPRVATLQRFEDQIREGLPDSLATTFLANRKTRRDDLHSACDAVHRITRKHDPEPAHEQQRLAAATTSRQGASKGGQARAVKLSAKQIPELARRAAAARWSKPR